MAFINDGEGLVHGGTSSSGGSAAAAAAASASAPAPGSPAAIAAARRGPTNAKVTAVFTLTNSSTTAAKSFPRYAVPQGGTVEVSPLGSNTGTVAIGSTPITAVTGPREIYATGAVPRNYNVDDVAEIGWLLPAVAGEGVMIRVLSGGQ